jgi:hypothetical protein
MRKRKPGPKPAAPTAAQRRRVELGAAIGLTVDEIASFLVIQACRRIEGRWPTVGAEWDEVIRRLAACL